MLEDLKEFEKFLKICRKQGVSDVSWNGCTVKLGELPQKAIAQEESEDVSPDVPSDEELAFYAVREIGAR